MMKMWTGVTVGEIQYKLFLLCKESLNQIKK